MAHSQTEAEREHFGWADGLRGLAALAVLSYEALEHAPSVHWVNPLLARAALATVHGFDALLVLSGLLLAYPILKTLRRDGRANLNLAAFGVGRAARILPLYFLVLALTVLVPLGAAFYGIAGLSHSGPSAHDAGLQAVFAGRGLGNDGLRAVAVQVRLLAIFPVLLGIYAFAPAIFAPLAVLALVVEYALPGLRWDVGAVPALMLGIVAADVLARGLRVERLAWPLAALAAAGAFALDPALARLPGPMADRSFLVWNPLWAVAAAALALACAQRPRVDRILGGRGLRQLAGASYILVLIAAPISATVLAHAAKTASLWLPMSAAAVSLAAAFALWLMFDRASTAGAAIARSLTSAAVRSTGAAALMSLGGPRPVGRRVPAPVPTPAAALPAPLYAVYGPLPTMQPGMLASVVQRIGSSDDLLAEIETVKHRLAEAAASAAFYEQPALVTVPEQLVLAREAFAYENEAGAAEPPVEGVLLPPVEVAAAPRTVITLGARPQRPTVRLRFGPGFEGAHAS